MDIDFVVLWVDSSDPKWQEEHDKYKGVRRSTYDDKAHFRDWDILRYWFRAVEKYAPWVRYIHFVTNGQKPTWLNFNHPKIKHVVHSDIIAPEHLPCFNAHFLNLNVHRIPGLSEHFVLFDDDMFINGPITPEYYFRNGLPCDAPMERINPSFLYSKKYKWGSDLNQVCDISVLNYHHPRREAIKGHFWRWHGPYLGLKHMLMSWYMFIKPYWSWFDEQHCERPLLKSVFEEVWAAEPELLNQSATRFRYVENLNIFLVLWWQLATNKFYPRKAPKRFLADLREDRIDCVLRAIKDESYKSMCLNDSPEASYEEYLEIKPLLVKAFEEKYPQKSSFEL